MTAELTLPSSLTPLVRRALDTGVLNEPPLSLAGLLQQLRRDRLLADGHASPVGKTLPTALYVHHSALAALPLSLQLYEACAHHLAGERATLVKFALDAPKLSYLAYPDFDRDPHPVLHASIQVNLSLHEVHRRSYRIDDNPPLLHRKETFVTPDYPGYADFARLTQQEERLGLLDNTRHIGTLHGWERCLQAAGVVVRGHRVVRRRGGSRDALKPKIERHRAAIARHDLSRPMKLALEAGLLSPSTRFFDYGCGYGGDVERIAKRGYVSHGWDPYYAPDEALQPAEVVNLGYVINVIEDPQERREALQNAWELAQEVLVVSAQVLVRDRDDSGHLAYGDGIVTRRRTFQKYYEQEELKAYLDGVLGVDAIPMALGVYAIFRNRDRAEAFRASRFRSRARTPRVRVSVQRFEEYRTLLEPLMQFFGDRGRLPKSGEVLPGAEAGLLATFGSYRRAFRLVLQATNAEEWEAIAERRRQELLIYLALGKFGKRPRFSQLEATVQYDVRAFFGTYAQALTAADLMLFGVGDLGRLSKLCDRSAIGQRSRRGLVVHVSALDALDPLLRIYEGCASRTIGRMEGATLIQFHTQRPKISYFFCPDFDEVAHPFVKAIMQIDLQELHVSFYDYDVTENPLVLHKKEEFVTPDYPLYAKFARLTQQETSWGLLDDMERIRRRRGWLLHLRDTGAELRGYRVCWRKDATPYQKQSVRSRQRRAREAQRVRQSEV